jgi:hypothetical protein
MIYIRVIKEAKRNENDKYVLRAINKSKATWHVINKEVGKSWKYDKIELNDGTQIISNPQNVAGTYVKHFFVEIIDDLLNQNSTKINDQLPKQRINCCSKTIFLYPVTEYETERVSKSLKGKLSAGYDEIPEYLVKRCIKHIYNASLNPCIFPDRLKTANIIRLYKKGGHP